MYIYRPHLTPHRPTSTAVRVRGCILTTSRPTDPPGRPDASAAASSPPHAPPTHQDGRTRPRLHPHHLTPHRPTRTAGHIWQHHPPTRTPAAYYTGSAPRGKAQPLQCGGALLREKVFRVFLLPLNASIIQTLTEKAGSYRAKSERGRNT